MKFELMRNLFNKIYFSFTVGYQLVLFLMFYRNTWRYAWWQFSVLLSRGQVAPVLFIN